MSRMISFWLLVAVIVILVVILFRVMAAFLLPLFLAAVLVVMFNPLHKWFLTKLKGRRRTAAAVTTLAVMAIVLLPIGLLVTMATLEGRQLFRDANTATLLHKFEQIRSRLGLDLVEGDAMRDLESRLESANRRLSDTGLIEQDWAELTLIELAQFERESRQLGQRLDLEWQESIDSGKAYDAAKLKDAWQVFSASTIAAQASLKAGGNVDRKQLVRDMDELCVAFENFKSALRGGKFKSQLVELVNPTSEQISVYAQQITAQARSQILSLGEATIGFLTKLTVGLVVMILAVYFFLLDGPTMIDSVKQLTPLDDRHEEMLIQEFDRVSRAVVVAALLSAVVQGIVAGIGYYIAGLGSIFLLTLMTMLFALIPVFGTSLVWLPCSFYLYLIDGRPVAAVLLALFGMIVVSQLDNFIKPIVLHGQSNIHPLVALLSILGGISALGPIGILVGPMVVAFLQTLLKILRREISKMDSADENTSSLPAGA